MKPRLFIFGLGYTASRIASALESRGWDVIATGRDGQLSFDDDGGVRLGLADASHVLSSVPPGGAPHQHGGIDPVLDRYGDALRGKRWIGYLSSTGVYGDTGGAWVDESAPIGTGRRSARSEADLDWQALHARVFRLPGIYGPGRSVFERVAAGTAQRIDMLKDHKGQVFSRVHVDDIVSGVMAALDAPVGVYNLADDCPTSQNTLIEEACRLMRRAPPPLLTLDQANLSPMARSFYAENRRVANGKAKRMLGWAPAYPNYRAGLWHLAAG